jgi:hypothetical protein
MKLVGGLDAEGWSWLEVENERNRSSVVFLMMISRRH